MNTARPVRYSVAVRRAAVEKLMAPVKEWLGNDFEDDETTLDDLTNAADSDAYDFAKNLESEGWFPDAELVEILTGYNDYTPHQEMVKQWVHDHVVTVSHKVGDVVILRKQPARIVAVRADTAEIVAQPVTSDGRDYGETGGWVHPAEDAKPAGESA